MLCRGFWSTQSIDSRRVPVGVALGNAAVILRQTHPQDERKPLIDYHIAVVMQSGVLMGVLLGVLLNLVLPELAIVVLLAVVLSYNSYKAHAHASARPSAHPSATPSAHHGLSPLPSMTFPALT
jgi:uncharacterized membrane protein YfcA